jgi:hypothetical protein
MPNKPKAQPGEYIIHAYWSNSADKIIRHPDKLMKVVKVTPSASEYSDWDYHTEGGAIYNDSCCVKATDYEVAAQYEVMTYFDVSTAHITAKDNKVLRLVSQVQRAQEDGQPTDELMLPEHADAAARFMSCDDIRYGYMLFLSDEYVEEEHKAAEELQLSEGFATVVAQARALGCKAIRLDRDAAEYPTLQTFEW